MGICLDTEQNNEELETSGERTRPGSGRRTPADAEFPMQNTTHVKFEPPNVPVIFVLGGPGSGKVTHCDNLMQERRGAVHINMTDLLQQYAIGNDMQDFGKLSSRTVTEVLMLEMKMAPAARAYLVSGYPRSMRDVAEYSDKIQTISGVVLVSWRQRVLERQIEYGARLGHVVLSLARMELNNFYRNVMPVADYFDQTNMLIAVNGERNPEEVYKDFRAAVLQILGPLEDQTMNGVSAVGVGAGGIPGEIVGVEPATRPADRGLQEDIEVEALELEPVPVAAVPAPVLPSTRRLANGTAGTVVSLKPEVIRVRGASTPSPALWVVGGPGSNKAALCERAVSQRQGWTQFSLGQRLRGLADSGGGVASDGALARSAVTGGELAPSELVSRLVRAAVTDAARSGHGLVLDGYPRDLEQMELYEREFNVTPRMVLLDCSKLQLGRGRRDDSVAAFRRRLEVFRELSLPMLKNLDQQHRLVIVDGDTDSAEVQAEFTRVLLEEMEKAEAIALIPQPQPQPQPPQPQPQPQPQQPQPQPPQPQPQPQPPQYTQLQPQPQYAQPLPQAYAPPEARAHASIPTTDSSKQLARVATLANGAARNGQLLNGQLANGFAGINSNKIKPLVGAALPTVSQLTHDEVRRLYEQSSGDVTLNTHM